MLRVPIHDVEQLGAELDAIKATGELTIVEKAIHRAVCGRMARTRDPVATDDWLDCYEIAKRCNPPAFPGWVRKISIRDRWRVRHHGKTKLYYSADVARTLGLRFGNSAIRDSASSCWLSSLEIALRCTPPSDGSTIGKIARRSGWRSTKCGKRVLWFTNDAHRTLGDRFPESYYIPDWQI